MAGADFDSIGRPIEIPFDTTQTIVETVPADRVYEIFAIAFQWTASSNAGNRNVTVRIRNRNGDVLFQRQSQRVQTADESIRYVWAPGMPDEADVLVFQLLQPMPLLQIEEGGIIDIRDVSSIDAADALAGSFSVRIYKGA